MAGESTKSMGAAEVTQHPNGQWYVAKMVSSMFDDDEDWEYLRCDGTWHLHMDTGDLGDGGTYCDSEQEAAEMARAAISKATGEAVQ